MAAGRGLRVVLAGGLGAMPFAGVAWQVLQHLEGLRRLGHEVFYLEDTGRWPYDPRAESLCADARGAVAHLARRLRRHGFGDTWAYRDASAGGRLHGCSERRLAAVLARADVLVNLSGVTVLREEHLHVPVRVYLETDPVAPQVEVAHGRRFTIDLLASHTHHFTYGANLGGPDCGVPLARFRYHPTLPPVILDWWSPAATPRGDPRHGHFTTIANWRQRGREVRWGGRRLGWSKHARFLRIVELPRLTRAPLELALAHRPDDAGVAQMRAAGWRIRPARPLSRDVEAYRRYIRASAGELSVAKEQNVVLRSGWFSDRSATYLAAGRPAVLEDTGFGCSLPTGRGLFAFCDAAEAAEALASIGSDPAAHSAAALAIAREHLAAEKVLAALIAAL